MRRRNLVADNEMPYPLARIAVFGERRALGQDHGHRLADITDLFRSDGRLTEWFSGGRSLQPQRD